MQIVYDSEHFGKAMPPQTDEKRFTILAGGYTVIDEKDGSLFFSSAPIAYFDAPAEVLQHVHASYQEHGPDILEAMDGLLDDLIDIGFDGLPDNPRAKAVKQKRQQQKQQKRQQQRRRRRQDADENEG